MKPFNYDKKELLRYELPNISEWISFSWGQNIIARITAWRVNNKMKRYNRRLKMEQFINKFNEKI